MICYKSNCFYCKNNQCTLEEISINEAGQCIEGLIGPIEELLKETEETAATISETI